LIAGGSASAWIAYGGDGRVTIGFSRSSAQPLFSDECQQIVGKGWVNNIEYRVSINRDDKLCFVATSSGQEQEVCGNTTLQNGDWYRFGVATQKLGNQTNVTIYLNGSIDGSGLVADEFDTNNNKLAIGRNEGGTAQYVGLIDNIRIYNKYLNLTEVESELSQKYAEKLPKFAYDFNLRSNTTAYDTHLSKWAGDWGIIMRTGDYDNSTQCVKYNVPGSAYVDDPIIRTILDNLVIFAALGIIVILGLVAVTR